MQKATGIEEVKAALRESYGAMATGIDRPKSVEWRLEDAARGRPCRPLGNFPDVAEACIDNNGAFHFVAAPLNVALSHIKRRFRGKMPNDMKSALCAVQKEQAEAECAELNLALSVNRPERSVLAAFIKEEREAMLAEEHVVELAEDRLCEMQEAR